MTQAVAVETARTVIPAGEWEIDPTWSALEFEVRKLGLVAIKGRVLGFTGTIVGGEEPSVAGTVDATTLTTFDETRDTHLGSPDFFDTQRYPELRFASTSVEQDGDEVVVQGELTIKGVTRPVELRGSVTGPEQDPWGNERLGLRVGTVVDRTAFGLNWQASMPKGGKVLANDVRLEIELELIKEA